ncbi:MAG: DUF3783 domain-containing protein [Selenomonas sp.]|uniref:DUF3783 domain-containing protein n=1 Tax=Selenomonas sp. TaxID=2053611 RepID=UPI0025EFC88A|nr:DUF3783 domain-containing protein [Selenomonas sp.]MCR5757928.1 DUF3783 domain-containing protein [Selenomonas sp.]
MKRQEQVLFYQFRAEEYLALACKTLHKMGIKTRILSPEDWREKVGFLLGIKGFQPVKTKEEDDFVFPHEVMILQNIRNKRLDEVLQALKDAGVPHIRFKAVVTPFNTLWTLRRLCETMQKEHGALIEQEKEND